MTPSRVRRVLVVVGASVAVAILAPYLVPTRADERLAPQPWVQFDSVRITDALFSPNGDGVRDRVTFSLSLLEPTKVHAFVSPAGSADTVAVLADSVPDPRISFVFSWDGKDSTGVVQPEGSYTVTLAGSTLADRVALFLQRQVRIDLTPPFVEVLAVIPPK